jgi:hypothetical protein
LTLNYTLKKEKVMDGDEEVATVRGLSLNDIIDLCTLNKESVTALFDQFSERDPQSISESEIMQTGLGMLKSAPLLIAHIIATATDAWETYDEADENAVNPLTIIMGMPTGIQINCLEAVGKMTFTASNPPKKMLALAFKMMSAK